MKTTVPVDRKNVIFTKLSDEDEVYYGWNPTNLFLKYTFPILFLIFLIVFYIYFE